jgi:hypothetical protein
MLFWQLPTFVHMGSQAASTSLSLPHVSHAIRGPFIQAHLRTDRALDSD